MKKSACPSLTLSAPAFGFPPARTAAATALAGLVLATGFTGLARAEVTLPSVLSSGMVLQRDKPVPVWGTAAPGEKVTVTFSGQSRETLAGADGKWSVKLEPLGANATGQTLTVQGSNKLDLTDVLVGEVWLGSGQSNMEWPVSRSSDAEKEIAEANFPQIRLFHVPLRSEPEAQPTCHASWKACSPETVPAFSAVLYAMGRELHRELGVPVGLINSSWGGSRIEPWTPVEGFAMVPSQRDIYRAIRSTMPGTGEYLHNMNAWLGNMEQWTREARGALTKGLALPPMPEKPGPVSQGFQGLAGLYNAMIHPLVPYAIRGAVWYQGESHVGEGMAYLDRKKALVGGWRHVWQQGDFPFYLVQLAPFNYGNQPPEQARKNTALAEIWEAQNECAAQIPNCGVAVINDIGDLKDIHPVNKREAGRRLSLIALARDYGRAGLESSGPVFAGGMPEEGGKFRVKFTHAGGGLVSRDGKPLTWFELAGADGQFHPAEAIIEGSGTVVVSSATVPQPKQVRFAWSQIAEPNLANREGLPASAFRSR